MIPKRIFYVWGYGEPKSRLADVCIENWRMILPEYEIIEINEKSKEWFDFDYEYENCLWFKTVYDLKMWAYVADYMRVKTLYEHGGIYLDTDVTIYKDFEPLLNHKMFIGNVKNNLPEMAICGVEKGHPILEKMHEFYQQEIWKSPIYIITGVVKKAIEDLYGLQLTPSKICENNEISVYPPEYFCPFHYDEQFNHNCITKNTFTCHWQNSSWLSRKNLFFLSNKHRLPLKALLKQLDFIEKADKNANQKVKIN